MKRMLSYNIYSHNNDITRILTPPSRRHPHVLYNGSVAEYEDAADYINVRALKGRVIA